QQQELHQRWQEGEKTLAERRAQRLALFGEQQVAEVREQLRAKHTACEQASVQAAEQWQKAQELRERLAGQQAGLQHQHTQMQERLQQAQLQWQQALADSEF
ncbi:hypothetical protein LLE87_30180, partial [Paenibacillus polymyxa]|nr:hypothetical protein [Paenibacillus polymyxa]